MIGTNMNKKILLYDIETSPSMGYYFELYREGNIVWNEKSWYMLSFAYKWLGEEKTNVVSLPMFKSYSKNREDDKELVAELWKLFDEADVVIAHNGNSFDQKKTNARFIYHNMQPPSPYKEIDTKLVAKRYFKFDSNKLTDLGKYLGLGQKLSTGGFELWQKCMAGDPDAWKLMCKYNKQDVVLLEQVYLKLRPWMTNHPNMNIISGAIHNCPNCNSSDIQGRGFTYTRVSKRQRYWCKSCGAWSSGEVIKTDNSILR
jgi:hypothetical protein